MRDVNTRDMNAGRDINIYDQWNQGKLLADLTIRELFEERQYRNGLLSQERNRKLKKVALGWVSASLVVGVYASLQYFSGNEQLAYGLLIGSQVLLALASITIFERPTDFEQRQMLALNEIACLLREKGAY